MRNEFEDNYEHIDESIEYILENILQQPDGSEEFKKIEHDFYSYLNNGCFCKNDCIKECIHGGNYEQARDLLLLRHDRKCKDLIYECNENCNCSSQCQNRLVQYGPFGYLEIRKMNEKGLGLITLKYIHKGSFICEYAGEILTRHEAQKRDRENIKLKRMNYIFCLNEIELGSNKINQTFIDPCFKGNIGRYLNHCCDPNCQIISVRCNSVIPKLSIFSIRDIKAEEELTFSYGDVDEDSEEKKPCLCNAEKCKKFLPNLSFKNL